jgi:hypothetical protein
MEGDLEHNPEHACLHFPCNKRGLMMMMTA